MLHPGKIIKTYGTDSYEPCYNKILRDILYEQNPEAQIQAPIRQINVTTRPKLNAANQQLCTQILNYLIVQILEAVIAQFN